jgi:hypothetical protein
LAKIKEKLVDDLGELGQQMEAERQFGQGLAAWIKSNLGTKCEVIEAMIAERIDAYAKVVLRDAKERDTVQWKIFDDKHAKQRALDVDARAAADDALAKRVTALAAEQRIEFQRLFDEQQSAQRVAHATALDEWANKFASLRGEVDVDRARLTQLLASVEAERALLQRELHALARERQQLVDETALVKLERARIGEERAALASDVKLARDDIATLAAERQRLQIELVAAIADQQAAAEDGTEQIAAQVGARACCRCVLKQHTTVQSA